MKVEGRVMDVEGYGKTVRKGRKRLRQGGKDGGKQKGCGGRWKEAEEEGEEERGKGLLSAFLPTPTASASPSCAGCTESRARLRFCEGFS